MIVTIQLHSNKLQHMQKEQYGAFVAYCFGLKNFHSIALWRTTINVSFAIGGSIPQVVDQAKIQAQLEAELGALADLDPHPCPCGCGAFLAITACLRQDGTLINELNDREHEAAKRGDHIQSIKLIRERTGLGLKDAKDLHDRYYPTIGR